MLKETYCSCFTTTSTPTIPASTTEYTITHSTAFTCTPASESFNECCSFFGSYEYQVTLSISVIFLTPSCTHCNALHCYEEGLQNSTRTNPKFSMCCSQGAIELPIANDTPEPIRVLLTETRVNANGRVVWSNRTSHFQQYIRS